MARRCTPGRFARDENAGVAGFGIVLLIATLAVAGGMVDATSGWRNRTLLAAAADIGAQTGAVAIAGGARESDVREMVGAVVQRNMPKDRHGNVLRGGADIVFAHYDPHLEAFTGSTPVNALIVRARRVEANGNPIRASLLKLLGMPAPNDAAYSAAMVDVSGNCASKEGIFARERVTLAPRTDVGPGLCVLSEDVVRMRPQTLVRAGGSATVPKRARCDDRCPEFSAPQISAPEIAAPGGVAGETHMVLPDFAALIRGTVGAFLQPTRWPEKKAAFFEGIGVGDQTELLDRQIIGVEQPKGAVVAMTPEQFHSVAELPDGLVYHVRCDAGGPGHRPLLRFDGRTGLMRNAVLLTDCALEFRNGARVIGSLVVTTREQDAATVTAGSSAIVADPGVGCAESKRTTIMAMSKVSVPAEFVMSNLSLIVNGDVDIAAAASGAGVSRGVGIHASGRVRVSSQHTFRACGNSDNVLVEDGKIVRIVPPPGGGASVSTAM